MKLLVLLFIFTASFNVYSKNNSGLNDQKLRKMSFNKAQSLRAAYIHFIIETKKYYQNAKVKESPDTVLLNTIKFLERSLYAYGADGDLCWFGGWPSKLKANLCQHPSLYRSDSGIKGLGDTYNGGNSCGDVNYFRCNPVLFGTPVGIEKSQFGGVKVMASPKNGEDKGYCVEVGNSFDELSQKCEAVSRGSIENIIDGFRNDPSKREQLISFDKGIFGENGDSGFCGTFVSNLGKKYDACDDLRKRLDALLNNDQLQEDKSEEAVAKQEDVDPYAQAKGILSGCESFLTDQGSDDVFSRNILAHIQGGMIECSGQGLSLPDKILTENELEQIQKQFQKMEYARNLVKSHFENSLTKLLVNEIAFMRGTGKTGFPSEPLITYNKEALKQSIAKHFPKISENDFNEVFEKVQNNISKQEKNIPKFKFPEVTQQFVDTSGKALNKLCSEIQAEYDQFKKTLTYGNRKKNKISQERKLLFWKGKSEEIKMAINQAAGNSSIGFLLGTKTFQEEILDPDIDYAQECSKNPNYKIMRENISQDIYAKALEETQDILFGDLKSMAGFEDDPEETIDNYLKYDKGLVLKQLLGSSGEELTEQAKYICARTQDIYDSDEWLEKGAILGGGLLTFGSSLLCLVPGAQVACITGMSAGVTLATAGGATKAIDGQKRINQAKEELMRGDQDYASSQAEQDNARTQRNGGVADIALNLVPAGVGKAVKIAKNAKATAASDDIGKELAKNDEIATGTNLAPTQTSNSKYSVALSSNTRETASESLNALKGQKLELNFDGNKYIKIDGDDIEDLYLGADGMPVIKLKDNAVMPEVKVRNASDKPDPDTVQIKMPEKKAEPKALVDKRSVAAKKKASRRERRKQKIAAYKEEMKRRAEEKAKKKTFSLNMSAIPKAMRRKVVGAIEKAFEQKETLLLSSIPAASKGTRELFSESDEERFKEERGIENLVFEKTDMKTLVELQSAFKNDRLTEKQKIAAKMILTSVLVPDEEFSFQEKLDSQRKKLAIQASDNTQDYLTSREYYLVELLAAIVQD